MENNYRMIDNARRPAFVRLQPMLTRTPALVRLAVGWLQRPVLEELFSISRKRRHGLMTPLGVLVWPPLPIRRAWPWLQCGFAYCQIQIATERVWPLLESKLQIRESFGSPGVIHIQSCLGSSRAYIAPLSN